MKTIKSNLQSWQEGPLSFIFEKFHVLSGSSSLELFFFYRTTMKSPRRRRSTTCRRSSGRRRTRWPAFSTPSRSRTRTPTPSTATLARSGPSESRAPTRAPLRAEQRWGEAGIRTGNNDLSFNPLNPKVNFQYWPSLCSLGKLTQRKLLLIQWLTFKRVQRVCCKSKEDSSR